MTLKFGTDGVRGVANREVTPELALALGRAAARVIGGGTWLVGRDTRRSGPMLAAALAAGLASEGAAVRDIGVLPTPGVAYLSEIDDVAAAMISASHNPFGDNGIKLFTPGGQKLDDDTERRLEAEILGPVPGAVPDRERPSGAAVGTLVTDLDGERRYAEHLEREVLEGRRLAGLRVVIDCANGAASVVAPRVLTALGARVTVLHAEPDGANINVDCGSNRPEALQQAVVEHGAQVGLAFDGDADRLAAVDAEGQLVDGDHIIAICAVDRHERGQLAEDTVVVTVMTNLGFRHAMTERDISVVETAVGDRSVLRALRDRKLSLGGEQSGHVIFADLATTGDGLLTGIQLLDTMARTGRPLADLASVMTRLPQVLVNVTVEHRDPDLLEHLAEDLARAEQDLGDEGRVLVRPSGTEAMVRVMVEAPSANRAEAVAERLAEAVRRAADPHRP